ncbi:MAG: hypothetical protein AAGD10_02035 [Myxococcota bacterium]
MKRVALVGAHTALAENISACAEDSDLELDFLRVTTTAHVTGDLGLVGPELLRDADALVLCFDDPVTRALWSASGEGGDRPMVAVGLDGLEGTWVEEPGADRAARVVVVPGPAEPVAAIMETLADLEPESARLVALESAASFDKGGMDALSEQTRAVFGMQDVAPRFLSGPMAFGLWSSSAPDGAEPDVKEQQSMVVLEAAMPEIRWSVSQLWAPSFSGEMFVLDVETRRPPEGDLWARLEQGRALRRWSQARLSSQDAVDRDDVLLTGLQAGSRGLRVTGAYDRLRRGGPTQVVRWLSRRFSPSGPSSE